MYLEHFLSELVQTPIQGLIELHLIWVVSLPVDTSEPRETACDILDVAGYLEWCALLVVAAPLLCQASVPALDISDQPMLKWQSASGQLTDLGDNI